MSGPMVEVDSVSKWFGDLVAVSDVSFTVGPGVTALLGPNGAGKSTLLRLLTGQATPSSGSVRVLGGDPRADEAVRAQVGVLPQQEQLFEHLRAERFVEIAAILQGVADPLDAARRALAQVEMDPDDTRRVQTYSKGMRQRVKLAQAIVHEPRVVFLDEPLTGLDPRQRAHLVDLMHGLGARGVCVLVSSHVLEEVERFGSDIVVIAQGRLAAQGDFHGIRALMDDRPMRVRLRSDQPSKLAGGLLDQGVVVGLQLGDDGEVVIDTEDAGAFARTVAVVARERDVRLDEVVPLDDDLESVFRYLVDPR
ncbi:MAG: ABC transporter ATP-binding protein [Actinomycetota bacterium]